MAAGSAGLRLTCKNVVLLHPAPCIPAADSLQQANGPRNQSARGVRGEGCGQVHARGQVLWLQGRQGRLPQKRAESAAVCRKVGPDWNPISGQFPSMCESIDPFELA